MKSKELWRENRLAVLGIMSLIILALVSMGYLGAVSGQSYKDEGDPFITDRVVEVRIEMSEENWQNCHLDALEEEYVKADFWFDGELIPDVAVRPKGNSSLNMVYRSGSPRLSFKVDFNFFNSARSFRGLKKINLNNGFNDPTLTREHLCYEIFEKMDLPTPRTAFVDLWVNDMHLGLYTQVEQVDVTFLERHFSDAGGNLYKPEPVAGYLGWTEEDLEEQRERLGISESDDAEVVQDINMGGAKLVDIMQAVEEGDPVEDETDTGRANPGPGEPADYLEQMGLRTNEAYPDHSDLLRMLEILNNEPEETFSAQIERVLDVDGVLRYIAVAAATGTFDSYLGSAHNYYLYEIDGKFTIIPWDLNGAFGVFDCGMSRQEIIDFYIDEPTCGPAAESPLVYRLLSNDTYRETYHEYLMELLEGPFSVERMISRIEQAAGLIRPYVQEDELKFFSDEEFERALYHDIPRGAMELDAGAVKTGPAQLPPEKLDCVRTRIDRSTVEELQTRRPTVEELYLLGSCLSRQEIALFLGQGGNARKPSGGAVFIGLRDFIVDRTQSIERQLSGNLASSGDGSGNGRAFGVGGSNGR